MLLDPNFNDPKPVYENSCVTVVIRSKGERTAKILTETVRQMAFVDQVINIDGLTFEECLEIIYESDGDDKTSFVLTMDGDLLTNETLLRQFFSRSVQVMASRCAVASTYGFCLDRFTWGYRAVGIRLYQKGLMPSFRRCFLKDVKGRGLHRPEAATMRRMIQEGFDVVEIPMITALHGFGQSPADIHRTLKLQMAKNPNGLASWVAAWAHEKAPDSTTEYALRCALGIRFGQFCPLTSRLMKEGWDRPFAQKSLERGSSEYKYYETLMGELVGASFVASSSCISREVTPFRKVMQKGWRKCLREQKKLQFNLQAICFGIKVITFNQRNKLLSWYNKL
jgi:hypothetical protein